MNVKRSTIIRSSFVVAFALLFLLIGGVFFSFFTIVSYWSFNSQPEYGKQWGNPRVDTFSRTKYLGTKSCRIIAMSAPPYDLFFDFYAATGTIHAVRIDRAVITYGNGEKVDLVTPEKPRTWTFERHPYSNWMSNGLVYFEDLFVQGRITNAITRNADFALECKAVLLRNTGETTAYTTNWSFHPERVGGIIPSMYIEIGENAVPGYPVP